MLNCQLGGVIGLHGYSGIIITKNDEIYRYQEYSKIPKELENKNINFFIKTGVISEYTKNKLKDFFEENIKGNPFPMQRIMDAGYNVTIYLNNIIVINNYKNIYDDILKIINEN